MAIVWNDQGRLIDLGQCFCPGQSLAVAWSEEASTKNGAVHTD